MNQWIEIKEIEWCLSFEEVGNRLIAWVVDKSFQGKVMVYENEKLLHTCKSELLSHSFGFLENSKVYFANQESELIEFNLETLEEKVLMKGVGLMNGPPGQEDFLAMSKLGALKTMMDKKNLKEVFPRIKECYWTAMSSLGSYSVMAGGSKFSLSDGSKLPKKCNYFLLVKVPILEVINHACPLMIGWSREKGTPVIKLFRIRVHSFHAML